MACFDLLKPFRQECDHVQSRSPRCGGSGHLAILVARSDRLEWPELCRQNTVLPVVTCFSLSVLFSGYTLAGVASQGSQRENHFRGPS